MSFVPLLFHALFDALQTLCISNKYVYTYAIVSLIISHKDFMYLNLGDLTDARRSRFETDQYVEEWQSYHNVIKESGVANNRPWLDLPGNHGELVMLL